MIADSPRNRWAIRITIALLRLHGPLCLSYTVWAIMARSWPGLTLAHHNPLNNPLLLGVCIPAATLYIFFLWYARRIQAAAIHPPPRTRDERSQLFDKVCAEVHDFPAFLRGWFLDSKHEEIGLDEVRKWIDWAFWEGRAIEAKEPDDNGEMNGYVQKIEELVGKPFKDGPGKAKALRLTLDPIAIEPRSLAWYSLMMVADTLAILSLKSKGFTYYRRRLAGLAATFPPRPAALCTAKVSSAPSLSYFLWKHTSKTRLPVIYIHGIGIGLLPHISFLNEMHFALNSRADPDNQVGILAIEILQVSSRLTTSLPHSSDFVSQLTILIDHHFGSSRIILVAHSYGTVLSTSILRDPVLSPRISGTLFIDPISILLYMPDVAYNFTRRRPVRANEWALWWFGKDPQVAHTLGRHLFWSECVLWRNQIESLIKEHDMKLTVSLSSEDLIVNTRSVRDYLVKADLLGPVTVESFNSAEHTNFGKKSDDESATAGRWQGVGLDVLWWNGYDHAEALGTRQDRGKLVRVVVEYCSGK